MFIPFLRRLGVICRPRLIRDRGRFVEVLLVRVLLLPETAAGLASLRSLLQTNGTLLALGDLNGDGTTTPRVAGNIVRTEMPIVHLLPNSNTATLQGTSVTGTSTGGNTKRTLNDTTKAWIDNEWAGRAFEITSGPLAGQARIVLSNTATQLVFAEPFASVPLVNVTYSISNTLQAVVTVASYNDFSQIVRSVDSEKNTTLYDYFPENDPNGDGVGLPPPMDRILNGVTGGYLKSMTVDAADPFAAHADRNSGEAVPFANIQVGYFYYETGMVFREIDPRGVVTEYEVNQLNQTVVVTHAASIEPGYPESGTLTVFAYQDRAFYDYNGNTILTQTEDKGDTSNVGAYLPVMLPGYLNTSGRAFVDTLTAYDILNNPVQNSVEVGGGKFITTQGRYDANENPTLSILGEGNASTMVFDERDLPFQDIAGAAGYNRPGGAGTTPSVFTSNYSIDGMLTQSVDATMNGGTASTISGNGDAETTLLDGFDRERTFTDAMGNSNTQFFDPAGNVIRVVVMGAPSDDVAGSSGNVVLSVTEMLYDELNRPFLTNQVLFQTPGVVVSRTPDLKDGAAMDAYLTAAFKAAGSTFNDTAEIPENKAITVIGRVTSLQEYDRNSRPSFTVQDDMDNNRVFFDGVGRTMKTQDDALDNGFNGSVRIAAGDVNGDGDDEIVIAAGPGAGPHVKVFDYNGTSGTLPEIVSDWAFADPLSSPGGFFDSGMYVSAADLDGDGKAELIVGAGALAGPHVKFFKTQGFDLQEIDSFFALNNLNFIGGVRLGTVDLDGDGRAEILVGTGSGITNQIRIFKHTGDHQHQELTPLIPFDPTFAGGIFVGGSK